MTKITEILGAAPGTRVTRNVDWWVINDAISSSVPTLLGTRPLIRKECVKVFVDHDTPCGSILMAMIQKQLTCFAAERKVEVFCGQGVSYQLMIDKFVKAGDIVAVCSVHSGIFGASGALGIHLTPQVFADSLVSGTVEIDVPETSEVELVGSWNHTHTGRVTPGAKDLLFALLNTASDKLTGHCVEFTGPAAVSMPFDSRITLCQLLDKTGAITGLFGTAKAEQPVLKLDLSSLSPMVAGPKDIHRIVPAADLAGLAVNAVFIGGCSGGHIEDLRAAADILRGRKVPDWLRLTIAPVSTDVFLQAADEGLLNDFLDAGAMLMNQGCSVCWGRSQGIVDSTDVLLSTGSRCSAGCAGSPDAVVYLCSPAVAAASALAGKICDCVEV